MRNFRDKLFPLSVLLLAFLVLTSGCGLSGDSPTAPPVLTLTIGSTTHEIQSSSYKWTTTPNGKNGQTTFADSDHPLRMEYDTPLTATDKQAALQLSPMPDDHEVYCWPVGTAIDVEGNTAVEPLVLLPHHGRIDLQEGSWIYSVKAEWTDTKDGGEANYVFCLTKE